MLAIEDAGSRCAYVSAEETVWWRGCLTTVTIFFFFDIMQEGNSMPVCVMEDLGISKKVSFFLSHSVLPALLRGREREACVPCAALLCLGSFIYGSTYVCFRSHVSGPRIFFFLYHTGMFFYHTAVCFILCFFFCLKGGCGFLLLWVSGSLTAAEALAVLEAPLRPNAFTLRL